MDEDDSNELDLGESDDDYVEHEKKQPKNNLNGQHDRLEEKGDNESEAEKSMKMFLPYWDAYDTVNQLFLEMGEFFLLLLIICICGDYLFGVYSSIKSQRFF